MGIGSDFVLIANATMNSVAIGAMLVVMGVGGLVWGYWALRRKRLMENIPTAKCQGVTIGLNELKARAISDTPLTSYLAEDPVVLYQYRVEEQIRRGGRKSSDARWKEIDSGVDYQSFQLQDDTGSIDIDPTGRRRGRGIRRAGVECDRRPVRGLRPATGHCRGLTGDTFGSLL